MDDNMDKFEEWLSKAMKRRGLHSQAELARLSGVSRQTISYWFSGKSKQPDEFSLQKIAKALGVPVEQAYRAAGILPPDSKVNEDIEEINELAKSLSKDDLNVVKEFIKTLDRLRGKK